MVKLKEKIKEKLTKKTKKKTEKDAKTTKPAKIADKPAHESDKNDDKMYCMALGGLEHVGQNMYVYKYKGKYLIVDCGMGFLEEEIGAGDVQYCDTTWLEKHKKDVVGFVITHGHEDHVGAFVKLINEENIEVENVCYSLLSDEWYEANDKRGYESEHALIEALNTNKEKIHNQIQCEENQQIDIDNIRVDIIRIANPKITNAD